VLTACRRHDLRFSITIRQTKTVTAAIAAIDHTSWTTIDYPDGGQAQVAETVLGANRLIVRRTRLLGPQATLWPDWRYHAFVTDRQGSPVDLDADHRRHAVCELAIRDLKAGAGLRHCPSGNFLANAAWLLVATLAHNLLRWVAALGLGAYGEPIVAKTLRRRLLTLPGRLTRSARRRYLHLPAGWPWAQTFTQALIRLRALPCWPELGRRPLPLAAARAAPPASTRPPQAAPAAPSRTRPALTGLPFARSPGRTRQRWRQPPMARSPRCTSPPAQQRPQRRRSPARAPATTTRIGITASISSGPGALPHHPTDERMLLWWCQVVRSAVACTSR
jgi:hypothetical protein